jgi:hypothetical protein
MKREVLPAATIDYAKQSAARIHKGDEAVVGILRALIQEYGLRAVSRATRQLKSERMLLRYRRRVVN